MQSSHRTLHRQSLCSEYTLQPCSPCSKCVIVRFTSTYALDIRLSHLEEALSGPASVRTLGPASMAYTQAGQRKRWLRGILDGEELGIKKIYY